MRGGESILADSLERRQAGESAQGSSSTGLDQSVAVIKFYEDLVETESGWPMNSTSPGPLIVDKQVAGRSRCVTRDQAD